MVRKLGVFACKLTDTKHYLEQDGGASFYRGRDPAFPALGRGSLAETGGDSIEAGATDVASNTFASDSEPETASICTLIRLWDRIG